MTSEASSLAGHWKLGKLIVLYDDNKIQVRGSLVALVSLFSPSSLLSLASLASLFYLSTLSSCVFTVVRRRESRETE